MTKNIRFIFIAIVFSASSALIYEICSNEALFYFFTNNTYSVTTILITFLLGLAIGGFLISQKIRKLKNNQQLKLLIVFQFVIGFYAIFIMANLNLIPALINFTEKIIPPQNFFTETTNKLLVGALYLLFPNILFGASFPLFNSLTINKLKDAGQKIASVYSLDLIGSVIGAILAGFVILPIFGIKTTFIFGACLNFISALILLSNLISLKKLILVIIAVFGLISIILTKTPLLSSTQIITTFNQSKPVYKNINSKDILYQKNSPFGLIEIISVNKENTLVINTKPQCSKSFSHNKFIPTFSLQNINKENLDVLIIGYGCGYTTGEFLKDKKISHIDVVEINPTIAGLGKYFFKKDQDPLRNKKVNLIINDGFKYLSKTNKKYDLILVDIENPEVAHSSSLYTVEGFTLVSKALSDKGIFEIHGYYTDENYVKIFYFSLKEAFPVVRFTTRESVFFLASKTEFGNNVLTEAEKRLQETIKNSQNIPLNTLNNQVLKYQINLKSPDKY